MRISGCEPPWKSAAQSSHSRDHRTNRSSRSRESFSPRQFWNHRSRSEHSTFDKRSSATARKRNCYRETFIFILFSYRAMCTYDVKSHRSSGLFKETSMERSRTSKFEFSPLKHVSPGMKGRPLSPLCNPLLRTQIINNKNITPRDNSILNNSTKFSTKLHGKEVTNIDRQTSQTSLTIREKQQLCFAIRKP